MYVYRIENAKTGIGPFNDEAHGEVQFMCAMTSAYLAEKQINVETAKFHATYGHSDYGCLSLRGIDLWFPVWLRKILKQAGFRLYRFQLRDGAPMQRSSADQVIFDKHDDIVGKTEFDMITFKELTHA